MSTSDTNKKNTTKLESSQAHAKKAFDSTTTAAQKIADHACSVASDAYQESKEEIIAAAREVGSAACESYATLAEQTLAATQNYREKLADFEGQLTDCVQEKPLQSIGVAFGIGLVLGILLNRK